jgi:hypothetical protein
MNYQQIRNFPDRFKASYTVKQFDELLPLFPEELLLPKYALNGKKRNKKYTPRSPRQLTTAEDKLFLYFTIKKIIPLNKL